MNKLILPLGFLILILMLMTFVYHDKCSTLKLVHQRQLHICDSLYHVVDSLKGIK